MIAAPGGVEGARRGRVASFDGLRAIAVLMVFLLHVDAAAFPGGFLGVEVFFVLSGYLITGLLVAEERRSGRISLPRFYARRALRLWPALLVLVVPVVLLQRTEGVGFTSDGAYAALYLTDYWQDHAFHLSLFAHTWSLAVEEQFYLVWPALLSVCLRVRVPAAWVIAAVALLGAIATVQYGHDRASFGYLPVAHLPSLAFGVGIALDTAGPRAAVVARLGSSFPACTAAALLTVGLFALHGTPLAAVVAAPVCGVLVAHLVTRTNGGLVRVLELRPLTWLGERSYGFYLWHYPIVVVAARHLDSPLLVGGIGLVLTIAITVASWAVVERPFLRLKTRYEPRPVGSSTAVGIGPSAS